MIHLFTILVYQPFFNILIFFYWMLSLIGQPDMGVALILLTIVIRILLLPLSLAEDRSEQERRGMIEKIDTAQVEFAHDPVRQQEAIRHVFRRNRGVVIAEIVSLAVQVMISLMLWKMFATGFSGSDLHLIYSFMPSVQTPFNLMFLGRFDLTRPSLLFNILQSFLIFLVETVSIVTSPYPPKKGEVVRLQLILPIVSFLIFLFLPAGKKLFIISTLIISLIILIYKEIRRRLRTYVDQKTQERLAAQMPTGETEKILVATKV